MNKIFKIVYIIFLILLIIVLYLTARILFDIMGDRIPVVKFADPGDWIESAMGTPIYGSEFLKSKYGG